MKLFVLLLIWQGYVTPVTDTLYTQQECESRAVQIMQVRDVEIVCAEVWRGME
ncbi:MULTISPECIES: hypothetical protein [Providencia]|uniref:hypothetical protein n=1 Tax=Providencia TaxID=586 RepID=UPI0018A70164|nr:hypothetical protein [Providencia vermicola]